MAASTQCLATLIAAPSSAEGKTIFCAAFARYLCRQGKRVQVFKLGPDYLDPTIHEKASGQPVYNLDLWVMGEQHCRALLAKAAVDNDVILIESVMGLYDNQPSNAQFARLFGLPVTLIVDVSQLAQTVAAIVSGLKLYDVGADVVSVIGNKVASDNHHALIQLAMGDLYAGSIRRDARFEIIQRHLGLVQAGEIDNLDEQMDQAAEALDEFAISVELKPAVFFAPKPIATDRLLHGKTIAIAKDAAFSFIYPMNTTVLERAGAKLRYFSPLNNEAVPTCDALWLPGGYPELYAKRLSDAKRTRSTIRAHYLQNNPILAECGGMMYLCNDITDVAGGRVEGCAILDANCMMKPRFQSVGLQSVDYGQGEIRGHSFHHSSITLNMQPELMPEVFANRQNGSQGEPVYRIANARLSYMHHYFASNIAASLLLFMKLD